MGLDMYLLRISDYGREELFYWRKAYPIMDWFENRYDRIEDLENYTVTKKDLTDLRDFCLKILEEDNFNRMDTFKVIEWTTEKELDKWFDYHMDWVKSTKSFLDDFLKNNEDWDDIIFKAWW